MTEIILFYMGRIRGNGKNVHRYLELVKGEVEEHEFVRKLSKSHEIGAGYTVETDGKIFQNKSREPVAFWPQVEQVGEWIHMDKAWREKDAVTKQRGQLRSKARKCITPELRRLYQAGWEQDRRAIVSALVEALEE